MRKDKLISTVAWIYVLPEDFEWKTGLDFSPGYAFYDSQGVRRLVLHADGTITVFKGYAWDGCTPKFQFWDILFGTPDGVPHNQTKLPKTYHASLVHDALYQFLDDGLPLTRRQADAIFLQILTRNSFAPRRLYHAIVRIFGGLFRMGRKRIRRYHGRCEQLQGSIG